MHKGAGCIHQDIVSVFVVPLQRAFSPAFSAEWEYPIPFCSPQHSLHRSPSHTHVSLHRSVPSQFCAKNPTNISGKKPEKPRMTTVRSNNGFDFTKSALRLFLPLCAASSLMQDFLVGRLTHSAPDFSLSLKKKRCQFKII